MNVIKKSLFYVALLVFLSGTFSFSRDLGMTYTRENMIDDKSGFLLGLGSGVNILEFNDALKTSNFKGVNFSFLLGYGAYVNKYIGLRFYTSLDTSFGLSSFYGFGGIYTDMMVDFFTLNNGFGVGGFAGFGIGYAGGITYSIKNVSANNYSGFLNILQAGLNLTMNVKDRLEFIVKYAYKPTSSDIICAFDTSCQNPVNNLKPLIFGINYVHTF